MFNALVWFRVARAPVRIPLGEKLMLTLNIYLSLYNGSVDLRVSGDIMAYDCVNHEAQLQFQYVH